MNFGSGRAISSAGTIGVSTAARPRFLLVEENRVLARMLVARIRPHGDVVLASVNGALAELAKEPVHWSGFILDVLPPAGLGLGVLEHARKTYPRTPALTLATSIDATHVNTAAILRAFYMLKCESKKATGAEVARFVQYAIRFTDPYEILSGEAPIPRRVGGRIGPATSDDDTVTHGPASLGTTGAHVPKGAPIFRRSTDSSRPNRAHLIPPRRRGKAPEISVTASEIVHSMAQATVDGLRCQYRLGHLVHMVRYDSSSVSAAQTIVAMSKTLHMDPSGLRRYARVTEVIHPAEFEALLQLRDGHGWPITWSHIELLAEVHDSAARETLTHQIVARGLSVRDLAGRLRAEKRARHAHTRETVSQSESR